VLYFEFVNGKRLGFGFSTNQDFKAELAKGLLEENEIKFVLLNRRDSTYLLVTLRYLLTG